MVIEIGEFLIKLDYCYKIEKGVKRTNNFHFLQEFELSKFKLKDEVDITFNITFYYLNDKKVTLDIKTMKIPCYRTDTISILLNKEIYEKEVELQVIPLYDKIIDLWTNHKEETIKIKI